MFKPIVSALAFCAALSSVCPVTYAAKAVKCFASSSAPVEVTSRTELTFNFKGPNADQPNIIPLCDGQNNRSATIDNAYLLLIHEERARGKKRFTPPTGEYFVLSYHYYNGKGTWKGYQYITLTVQDRNHRQLLDRPIYQENTPRSACRYGRGIDILQSFAMPKQLHFGDIGFVTISIPRVSGHQGPC